MELLHLHYISSYPNPIYFYFITHRVFWFGRASSLRDVVMLHDSFYFSVISELSSFCKSVHILSFVISQKKIGYFNRMCFIIGYSAYVVVKHDLESLHFYTSLSHSLHSSFLYNIQSVSTQQQSSSNSSFSSGAPYLLNGSGGSRRSPGSSLK